MYINLKNKAGVMRRCKVGYSWTSLFFGFLVPLLRGDWKWAVIMFIAAMFTFNLSCIVFGFIYNRIYVNELLEKGYVPADEFSQSVLVDRGFLASK